MKSFVTVATVFCIFVIAVQCHLKIRQNMQECLQQFNSTKSAINDGTINKCFFRCFEQKNGVMAANGTLSVEGFRVANPNAPANLITAVQTCVSTSQRTDPCDTGKAMYDCMQANLPRGGR